MPYADIGGYSMYYELDNFTDPWKQPETVLLHAGYCRNSRFWYAWVPGLARHYQVLRPDHRGSGESPSPGPDFQPTIEGFVDDVMALMDHLRLERVHYVGESFGGVVGIQMALTHPERLHSLTLCNTGFRILPKALTANSAGFPDRLDAIDELGLEGWCRKTIDVRLDQERASAELSNWYCQEIGRADPLLAKRLSMVTRYVDFSPRMAEIKVPTLLLAPGKSKITDLEQQRFMANAIPDAKLVVIENVGHGVNVLEPERCTLELLDFLAGRKAGASQA
ncbi:MAG TPA: alpha/beta fold hydrolase [Chloroflexota bacterium]|nr:alpha/beta fold hydrolase [Chloroflexota bacterium]